MQTYVFIDGDYLYYSIKSLNLRLNFVRFSQLLTQLFDRVASIRYYTSFDPFSKKQSEFLSYLKTSGFMVISILPRRVRSPSKFLGVALDLQLAVDAMSISHRDDTVVLVTGDIDFVPLLRTLKQEGISTVVMALPIVTSPILKEIPDLFISLERLIAESTQLEKVAESKVPVTANEQAVESFFLDKGLYYGNYVKVRNVLKSASHQITIIDSYINDEILETASILNPNVQLRVISSHIEGADFFVLLKKLKREGRNIDIYISREFHDRFIRVDDNWWHLGHSIKDLGSGVALMLKITEPSIIMKLQDKEKEVYKTTSPQTGQ